MAQPDAVPAAMKQVIPHLTVKGAARAIEFYRQAFGAKELARYAMPDGSIMHATIQIGEGVVMLNDEVPDFGCVSPQTLGNSPVYLMLYVPDVDTVFQRALDAGATAKMAPADQFWGDRYGLLVDPFGHYWEIATHLEDVSKEELERRGREAMSQGRQN
jgi:PhnB protein